MKKLLFAAMIYLAMACNSYSQLSRYSFVQPKMGSLFTLVIYAADSLQASKAAEASFLQLDTLNSIYSDYLPFSELNRLCASAGSGSWCTVSEPLYSVLKKAYQASAISMGTFDITVSPVVRLWREARKAHKLPNADSLAAAMAKVSYMHMKFNDEKRKVKLLVPGMQLDLGGIAKGESAQRVVDRLKAKGFVHVLIDAGGDVVVGDAPPGRNGWKVAINLPGTEDVMDKQLNLHNMAVTTSGDLYQYVEIDGVRYSHIIDPRNGQALTNSRNVTVIAPKGADADWLTKACSILPIPEALKLVETYNGAAVQIAVVEDGVPRYFRSHSFASYFK